jgi:hypothetical protein
VIHDVDQTIAACLSRWLPGGTVVRFDAPDGSWAGPAPDGDGQAAQILGAFLYDIREDPGAAAADPVLVRDDEGRAMGWQPPIRKYRMSYLLTAWAGDAPDGGAGSRGLREHELLGSVLVGCVTQTAVPPDCLRGTLARCPQPVLISCAAADHVVDVTHLWSSLGVAPRTTLDLMVLVPVIPALLTELAPPSRSIDLGVSGGPDNGRAAADEGTAAQPSRWERSRISEDR